MGQWGHDHPAEDQSLHHHAGDDEYSAGARLCDHFKLVPIRFSQEFRQNRLGTLCKIPLPGDSVLEIRFPLLLFVAGVIAGDLLLRRLRYLRQVYFVGSNEEAARLTGIPTARVKTMAFMVTGLLAAMAGVISTSRVDAVDANGGMGAELRVIAAVIVGGASLSGGRGTILGSFFGLLLMQIIKNGLTFIDVPAEAHFIASGLVLILAAVIDQSGSSLVSLLFKQRNKRMERVINIVLVLALIGGVAFHFATRHDRAVGPAGPPEESTAGQHYEMISFITGGPYWLDSKAGLYDKAKELGVHAVFTGPPVNDVNKQIEAIHTAIAKKVDGMIVVPISDGVAPAINKAIEAGIPVVTADNDAPASNRYTYVGTGNFNAGYLGGEQLAELLGKRGEVALMYIPGCDNLIKRVEGYKAALASIRHENREDRQRPGLADRGRKNLRRHPSGIPEPCGLRLRSRHRRPRRRRGRQAGRQVR